MLVAQAASSGGCFQNNSLTHKSAKCDKDHELSENARLYLYS